MSEFIISNLRSIYITNQPYRYPSPWLKKRDTGSGTGRSQTGDFLPPINTGWHIIPNLLWGHLATPKQWWDMVVQFEAISVKSINVKLFNPIPIQTALSFQGTNTFPAFNNTVYAMTYKDDIYETPWFNWHGDIYPGPISMYYEWNPAYKEGLIPKKRSDKYEQPTDTAKDISNLQNQSYIYPKQYTTQITQNLPNSYQNDTYRRQQLPIYWYSYPFPQYGKHQSVTSWNSVLTYFEEGWIDPSGIFWDPLNRPHEIGELRPGKNMIEFSWENHPSDDGIWFNTDRVALLPPYPRPRPLQIPSGTLNLTDIPNYCEPITPGRRVESYEYLIRQGLIVSNEDRTVPEQEMAPENMTGLPNWRDFPCVPMRWFLKEIQESNPWAYEDLNKCYYQSRASVTGCKRPSKNDTGLKSGDVEIHGPPENTKFPGTEYEMYKYPPTQWFIKGVPLYDNQENHIPVEMQMFMSTTVTILGKKRNSALYAPAWGPINNQDLYSINMDTVFGENYIRGRSAGARRTWYNPDAPRNTRDPQPEQIILFKQDGQDASKFPVHPEGQCIVNPENNMTHILAWPKVTWIQHSDSLKVSLDVKDGRVGSRVVQNVKMYEGPSNK